MIKINYFFTQIILRSVNSNKKVIIGKNLILNNHLKGKAKQHLLFHQPVFVTTSLGAGSSSLKYTGLNIKVLVTDLVQFFVSVS